MYSKQCRAEASQQGQQVIESPSASLYVLLICKCCVPVAFGDIETGNRSGRGPRHVSTEEGRKDSHRQLDQER